LVYRLRFESISPTHRHVTLSVPISGLHKSWAPEICLSSVWNFLRIFPSALRIVTMLLDPGKISANLT